MTLVVMVRAVEYYRAGCVCLRRVMNLEVWVIGRGIASWGFDSLEF